VYVCVCVSVQLYESRALLTHSYTRTLNVLSSVSRSSQKRHSLTPSASAKDSHVWLVWYGVAVHMRVCVYKYVCVCVCCQYACINIYIEMCVCVCVCVCVCMNVLLPLQPAQNSVAHWRHLYVYVYTRTNVSTA
jgi:hypothetical protein